MSSPLRRIALRARTLAVAACAVAAACSAPADSDHSVSRAKLAAAGSLIYREATLDRPLDRRLRRALAVRSISVLTRLGSHRFLLAGPSAGFDALEAEAGVSGVRAALPSTKIAPSLRELAARRADRQLALWAVMARPRLEHPDDDARRHLALLRRFDPHAQPVGFAPIFELSLEPPRLVALAARGAVRWLQRVPAAARPLLDESRREIGVEKLQGFDGSTTPPRYALAGRGTTAGIWDPHGVEKTHGDLSSKLLRAPRKSDAPSLSHGTGVASCLAGSGARSHAPPKHPWKPYQLRGMAPLAKLAMYLTSDDHDAHGKPTGFLQQYREARAKYAIDVASFSFSHRAKQGSYSASAANLDTVIAARYESLPRPIPIMIAAANDGWHDGYISVSALSSAKNTITVGGSDWATGQMWGGSSVGPTRDGRLKPEVMAPGCSTHGKIKIALDRVRLLNGQGETVRAWTFDRDLDGWRVTRGFTKPKLVNRALTTTTTANGATIVSPAGIGLPADWVDTVELRMSVSRHHRMNFYWTTSEQPSFSWRRRKTFAVANDNKLHLYRIDVSKHSKWSDRIEQLRLDPITSGIALAAPGNTYTTSCGTSMATPITAGSALLLLESYRKAHPAALRPQPALFKALLAGTARDMVGSGPAKNPDIGNAKTPYPKGPDFATGYGEIDVAAAVEAIRSATEAAPTLHQGTLGERGDRYQLRLRAATGKKRPIRVTLAWDDPAAEPSSRAVLQNDLDLEIHAPDNTTLRPWQLDGDKPSRAATRGLDRKNNLEQVVIESPTSGAYTVTVTAHQLTLRDQPFALVVAPAAALASVERDRDGDGSFSSDDCDDSDADVRPTAQEIPGNGRDDDCDPKTSDRWTPSGDGAAGDGGPSNADDAAGSQPSGCALSPVGTPRPGPWPIAFVLGALLVWPLRRRRRRAR